MEEVVQEEVQPIFNRKMRRKMTGTFATDITRKTRNFKKARKVAKND